jgi:hypothetical protein
MMIEVENGAGALEDKSGGDCACASKPDISHNPEIKSRLARHSANNVKNFLCQHISRTAIIC